MLLTAQTFELYVDTVVHSSRQSVADWLADSGVDSGVDGQENFAVHARRIPVEVLVECLHVLFSHRLRRAIPGAYWPFVSQLTDRVTTGHVTDSMIDDLQRGRYWLLLAVRSGALDFYLISLSSHMSLCRQYYQEGAFMLDAPLLKRVVTAASRLCAAVRSHLEPKLSSDGREVAGWKASVAVTSGDLRSNLIPKVPVNVRNGRGDCSVTSCRDISSSAGVSGCCSVSTGSNRVATASVTCNRCVTATACSVRGVTASTCPDRSVITLTCPDSGVAAPAYVTTPSDISGDVSHRCTDVSVKASSLSSDSGVLSPLLPALHSSLSDTVVGHGGGVEHRGDQRHCSPRRRLPAGRLHPMHALPAIRVSWAGTPAETRAASLVLGMLGQRGAPEGSEDPPPSLSRQGSSLRLDKASGPSNPRRKRFVSSHVASNVPTTVKLPQIYRGLCFKPGVVPKGTVGSCTSWQRRIQDDIYDELARVSGHCPAVKVFPESSNISELYLQNMVQYLAGLLKPNACNFKVCFSCLFQSWSDTYTFRPCHVVITSSSIVLLVSESAADSSLVFVDTIERYWNQRVWQLSDINTVKVGACGQTVSWVTSGDYQSSWQLQLADSAAASHLVSWLMADYCRPALIRKSYSPQLLYPLGEREIDVFYSSLVYFSDVEYVDVSAQLYSYLFFKTASSEQWMPAHCLLWSGELQLFRPVPGQAESEQILSAGARPPQITWPLFGSIIGRCVDARRQLCLQVPSGSRQLQLLLADEHTATMWLARLESCRADSLLSFSNQRAGGGVPVPRRLLLSRSSLYVLDCVCDMCCDLPLEEPAFSASTVLSSISHVYVHNAASAVIVELSSFDPLTSCGMWWLYFISTGEMIRFTDRLNHLVQQNSPNVVYRRPPSYRCARAIEAASSRIHLPWQPM